MSSIDYDGLVVYVVNGGRSFRWKILVVKNVNCCYSFEGNGFFLCFSKICGVECSFVCGGGGGGLVDYDELRKGGVGCVYCMYFVDDLSFL